MRRLALVGLALALTAAVLGCSGDDAAPSQEAEAAAVQQEQPQVEQPEPQAAVEQQEQVEQEAEEPQPEPERVQEQETPDEQTEPQSDQPETKPKTKFVLGGERPATLLLPADESVRTQPRPLIVLLHGYSSNSREADAYFGFSSWVDEGEFGLLLPDGTVDEIGNQFWNGTPECCDIFGTGIDDVAYLTSLIAEARTYAEFDQVFAVGHSNGGFMSYRLACEEAGLSGIVSLAGGAFADPELCRAPDPLAVLQIHGDADSVVLYRGGRLPQHPDPDRAAVPGAWESARRWAERAGCDINAAESLPRIDTEINLPGDDTTIKRMIEGCAEGVKVELWTIEGGGHVPWVWGTEFSLGILYWIASVYEGELESMGVAEPNVAEHEIGGERPTLLLTPKGVEGPLPLIVSLHGYGGEASAHDWYFGLSERVEAYGFALITPQGTTDGRGNAFWNATDYCCNFDGSDVDDAGYIASLIDEARGLLDIGDVHVVGYSNGGFMAYRLACDGLDGLVAIASLAGSSFSDETRCDGAAPVSVLQIHGDEDLDIPYEGTLGQGYSAEYPGAEELLRRWARRAGCDIEAVAELERMDLDRILEGAETRVQRVRDGCADGVTVELWTIEGGDHGPFFQDDWPKRLLNWLLDDSRAG